MKTPDMQKKMDAVYYEVVAILPVAGEPVPLPAGESGLLAVHRTEPALMLGYWNRPEEEAEVTRGDWFVGGDLARLDADGYLWFEGRNNDLMKAMGYRVSPNEVEAVLSTHPSVAEVGVAELPVRADVSVICGFVVLQPGVEYRMKDPVGSDMICTAGVGTVGTHIAAAPRALKPGDLGNWCFVIPAQTAKDVVIKNTGDCEMVLLRTFGPDHPGMPVLSWQDRSKLVVKPRQAKK